MLATLETLADRVSRLEATVERLTEQVSQTHSAPSPQPEEVNPEQRSTSVLADLVVDKRQFAEGFRKFMERMGISGEPIPAEELQQRMAREGIGAEDNEFSRAIIAEREK